LKAVHQLGWWMVPLMLAAPLIDEGRLIELAPQKWIAVTLYWQRNCSTNLRRRCEGVQARTMS